MSTSVYAQFETDDELSDDLGLYYEDDEAEEKPQHREYKNVMQMGYTPSRYTFNGASPALKTQGFSMSWAHAFQVQEKTPLFVELGALMKYDASGSDAAHGGASYQQLAFRAMPLVTYKLYLSRTRDISIAPLAGVYFQIRAMGKEKLNGVSQNIVEEGLTNATGATWMRCQLGWQTGVRFCLDRYFLGFTYSQDFPNRIVNDKNLNTALGQDKLVTKMHEYSLQVGICF